MGTGRGGARAVGGRGDVVGGAVGAGTAAAAVVVVRTTGSTAAAGRGPSAARAPTKRTRGTRNAPAHAALLRRRIRPFLGEDGGRRSSPRPDARRQAHAGEGGAGQGDPGEALGYL